MQFQTPMFFPAAAAEQATRELPQLNRATYDRATAIYNGLAIQKAATDSLFSVHQTSRKHMRAFCFESHAKFIATLRLTNALGTNPAPPESSIEADRNVSTVGSTTDADTGIQPGMGSASDILSSLAQKFPKKTAVLTCMNEVLCCLEERVNARRP